MSLPCTLAPAYIFAVMIRNWVGIIEYDSKNFNRRKRKGNGAGCVMRKTWEATIKLNSRTWSGVH